MIKSHTNLSLSIMIILFIFIQSEQIRHKIDLPSNDRIISVMMISDIHIDPFFCPYNYTGDIDRKKDTYSSCNNYTLENMFLPRSLTASQYNGQTTDPPLNALTGVINHQFNISEHKQKDKVIVFTGDAIVHVASRFNLDYAMEYLTMTRIMNEVKTRFNPDEIFWTNGNNDLEHHQPCTTKNAVFDNYDTPTDRAYADSLINAGIVNDKLNLQQKYFNETLNQTSFFRRTGYYVKQVFDTNLYAMVINNACGGINTTSCLIQFNAQITDCKRLPDNARIVTLSHQCDWRLHSENLEIGTPECYKNFIDKDICPKIMYKLCGHKHRDYYQQWKNNVRIPSVTRSHGAPNCPCYSHVDFYQNNGVIISNGKMINQDKIPLAEKLIYNN